MTLCSRGQRLHDELAGLKIAIQNNVGLREDHPNYLSSIVRRRLAARKFEVHAANCGGCHR